MLGKICEKLVVTSVFMLLSGVSFIMYFFKNAVERNIILAIVVVFSIGSIFICSLIKRRFPSQFPENKIEDSPLDDE